MVIPQMLYTVMCLVCGNTTHTHHTTLNVLLTDLLAPGTDPDTEQTSPAVITCADDVTSLRSLIARRLLTSILPIGLLIVGILIRHYVIITPAWTSLCLPQQDSNIIAFNEDSGRNSSLPNCTDFNALLDSAVQMPYVVQLN